MNNIQWDFSGKTCFVVGGSRGIGKAIVEVFNKSGAQAHSISRSNCDISCTNQVDLFFKKNTGPVDILVNAAAINFCKTTENINVDEWNNVFNVNLRGAWYFTKKALERMPEGGRIVNVSSIAGRHRSLVSGTHYTSSKAGLIGLTKQLAFEVAPRNINVNAVCPSQTKTEMLRQSMSEKQIASLAENIPLKRVAEIEEQVNPILFLCSQEASYITGAVLDVNGGQI
jgi:3-oxoacyl-[acyl-carrier protein] reductase